MTTSNKIVQLFLVALLVSLTPATAAVKATTVANAGDGCLREGRVAPGRGIDKSDLICTKMTIGSAKGKLLWWYPKLNSIKILEIISPIISKSSDSPQVIASRSADRIGGAIGAALKTEELIKDYSSKNFTGGSGALALSTFQAYKNRQATSFVGSLSLITGMHSTKSNLRLTDSRAIAQLVQEYEAIAVPAESKYKSLDQLINDLTANPKSVTFIGGALGGVDHVFMAKFLNAIGVDPRAANYLPQNSGFEVVNKTMSNKSFVGLSTSGDFVTQFNAERLRVLGVAAPERVDWIRVKTLQQQGVNLVFGNWYGIFVPPQLSEADVTNFVRMIDSLQNTPTWRKTISDNFWSAGYLSQEVFSQKIEQEINESKAIVQQLGL